MNRRWGFTLCFSDGVKSTRAIDAPDGDTARAQLRLREDVPGVVQYLLTGGWVFELAARQEPPEVAIDTPSGLSPRLAMNLTHDLPEARLYDLIVDGKKQQNWASGDEVEGEYELFVEDWRSGARIPDSDNPTGYQTLKQKGKVEFKRNDLDKRSVPGADLPDPLRGNSDPGMWNDCWGNYCGAVDASAVGASLQEKWGGLSPACQQFISERLEANGCFDPILLPLTSFTEWKAGLPV